MAKPIILGPDEGEQFDAAGDRYRFLAEGKTTDGAYGLFEATVPPGGGPPPHLHTREEEGFYVIAGTVTIHVDGQEFDAGPGSFVNMPKHSTHWFRNNSKQNVKLLILVAPGGMEQMFREVGTPVADEHDTIVPFEEDEKERLLQTAQKYGLEIKIPAGD